MWRAVEQLSVDLKMALLLRDIVGLSYTEIADSLEVTLATVKWRIYKAREEVQLALAREGITFATTGEAPAEPALHLDPARDPQVSGAVRLLLCATPTQETHTAMKRMLVLLFAVVSLLVAASAASAATAWKGVVVAKDAKRGTVVTASAGGVVRTTRSPNAHALKIGQRLDIRGTALADGDLRGRNPQGQRARQHGEGESGRRPMAEGPEAAAPSAPAARPSPFRAR